jgi:hypothetical protein
MRQLAGFGMFFLTLVDVFKPLVGPDWILLHQQQAEGHHQHAGNKSKEAIVPFAVGAARGQ